jgi:hypothetical protein
MRPEPGDEPEDDADGESDGDSDNDEAGTDELMRVSMWFSFA